MSLTRPRFRESLRATRYAARRGARRTGEYGAQVAVVLQPIVDVADGSIVAAEALARFPGLAGVSVEQVFIDAHAAGHGGELEAACLHAALATRPGLPEHVLLCVNLSPQTLTHPAVQQVLHTDLSGVVIEVTEQATGDVDQLLHAVAELRRRGALIAVDDASTGYAGLLRLARLRPDIVKLDRALITGTADHVEHSAVIEALVTLSRRIGARVLAEGVETLDDLTQLAALDVDYAQGWAIARPAQTLPPAAPAAVAACRAARAALLRSPTPAVPMSRTPFSDVTAALAATVTPAGVHAALHTAALALGIDVIGLSILDQHNHLTELTATGADPDQHPYPLTDYPATAHALATNTIIEAHLADPETDQAERDLLARQGLASLLLTPITTAESALGILEFSHHTHRRWTSRDITQARALAYHLAHVLPRLPHPDTNSQPDASQRPAAPADAATTVHQ